MTKNSHALQQEYDSYLERFRLTLGEVPVGGFAKHEGRLVQKLPLDEFETCLNEFSQLHLTYTSAVDRGDTINDAVVRLLREYAARLMRKDPVFR